MSNQNISDVLDRLNSSPWKGVIAEVGLGVPVSYTYLSYPNYLQTIIKTCSPLDTPFSDSEQVTLESNIRGLLDYTQEMDQTPDRNQAPRFYLAVCGRHKTIREEGENQGWLALRTSIPRETGLEIADTLIHFKISKVFQNREIPTDEVLSLVNILTIWLFKTLLLGDYESWSDAIAKFPYSKIVHVDVIRDPRISNQEHLTLASATNPLVSLNGAFTRAVDTIQTYSKFVTGQVSGKFEQALYVQNLGKELEGVTVDPTRDTIYIKDHSYIPLQVNLLQKVLKDRPFTVIIDGESFNKIFDPQNIPASSSDLFIGMDPEKEKKARESILAGFLQPLHRDRGVTFQVICEEGYNVIENQWLENINFEVSNS